MAGNILELMIVGVSVPIDESGAYRFDERTLELEGGGAHLALTVSGVDYSIGCRFRILFESTCINSECTKTKPLDS